MEQRELSNMWAECMEYKRRKAAVEKRKKSFIQKLIYKILKN